MKYIILLAGILFCLYRIIQGLKDREEQRRIIEAEKQREADAARLREEWRQEKARIAQEQARYKANLLRVQALEKEQALARKEREEARKERERLLKEQDRQRKEQERQAKEQERQAAILEKHEEMLRKHEFQLRQAKRDIDFLKERLGQQEAQRDYLLLQQEATVPGSKEHDAIQRKIVVLDNQIHSTVSRYNRAVFNAKEAERKVG